MKFDRLNDGQIIGILKQRNNVHTNSHFVGTSERHLNTYVDKDGVCTNPIILDHFGFELAHRIVQNCSLIGENVVAVVGAPMGAISLGSFVAKWLNSEYLKRADGVVISSIYAEKTGFDKDDPFKIRDAYGPILAEGKGIIVIEDILNTAGSAQKTLDAIRAKGGNPVAVGAICNRGGAAVSRLGCKVIPLASFTLESYAAEECPLCAARVPMNIKLGHGAQFVEKWNAAHPDDHYPVLTA